MSSPNNFYDLDPNLILNVAEQNNFHVSGELIQLNSYENRVFDVRLEKDANINTENQIESVIAKFYRPNRWSLETIQDEHLFIKELKEEGISVAEAYQLKTAQLNTVGNVNGIYYAFFEKVRGRLLQEMNMAHYKKIGRWLARLHNVGAKKMAPHRGIIGPTNDNKWQQLEKLLTLVSPEVSQRYESAAVQIFETLDEQLENFEFIRLHGDLHRGNILENSQQEFTIVDFDDMINGPAIQDFWMLMPSDDNNSTEFNTLIEAYSELREFPYEQLELIPLLRGYRIITYAMWIMNRWQDPSFKKIFPDFGEYTYWAEETESIEKISFQI